MESPIPSRVRFPWRPFLYGAIVLYLVADLRVFHGPLYHYIQKRAGLAKESSEGNSAGKSVSPDSWVATVNAKPITRGRLDQAAERYLFLRGQRYRDARLRIRLQTRMTALEQLIQDDILRQYARLKPLPIPEGEVERRFNEMAGQFGTAEEFQSRLKLQRMTEAELRAELTEDVHITHWIESKIARAIGPTPEEVDTWYATNSEQLRIGEAVQASHIFLSTVDPKKTGHEARIRALRDRILAGESFEELAREHSDDPRSKKKGGDLGYFTKARIPKDFADAVFALEVGELSEPFQTKIGWHLAKVSEKRPSEVPSLELMRDEISIEIANSRRAAAVKSFHLSMRGRPEIKYFERAIRDDTWAIQRDRKIEAEARSEAQALLGAEAKPEPPTAEPAVVPATE